jgi:kynurenine formamidase
MMNDFRVDCLEGARVVDLGVEYFPGMPYIPATPPFQYGMTREHGDQIQPDGLSSASDQILIHMHSGTHIDSLSHYARHGCLHGGVKTDEVQSKFRGFEVHGVESIPPIIRRGVFLDIPRAFGKTRLDRGMGIGAAEIEKTVKLTGVEVMKGDVVLIRTGDIQLWPNQEYYDIGKGGIPGLTLDGAQWLTSRGVYLIGSDNYPLEQIAGPAGGKGRRAGGMPVHGHLLVDNGVYIIETMNLEELSEANASEFLFIALPLKVRGATGCPVRPVAVLGMAN